MDWQVSGHLINSSFLKIIPFLRVTSNWISFFDLATELDPCREAIGGLVDELAQKLYKGGKIKSKA